MPTAEVVRNRTRRLPGVEVPVVLVEAFGHREGADTDNLGPPAGTDLGVVESESSLADGSHEEGMGLDRVVVLALVVLRERPEDNCLVAADAEWMVEWRCRTGVDQEAADQELEAVGSCLVEDVVQPVEMCKLEEVRDLELQDLP